MKILIDGDSCNVINKTVKKASKKNIEVHIYCDTKHYIQNDYAIVHIIDAGPDAVDFAIANNVEKGDIVLTNDGGLAAMVKAKQGKPQKFCGAPYTDMDIQEALAQRYIRNVNLKRINTKNLNSHHGKRKKKTVYIKECWA